MAIYHIPIHGWVVDQKLLHNNNLTYDWLSKAFATKIKTDSHTHSLFLIINSLIDCNYIKNL